VAQQASKRCEGVMEDDLTGRHVMLMHHHGSRPPSGERMHASLEVTHV